MKPGDKGPLSQFLAAFTYLPDALRLVWDSHHGYALVLAVTTVLQALLPAASAFVAKLIIDNVVQAVTNPQNALGNVKWCVGLAFIVAIAGQGLNSLAQVSQELLQDLLGRRINVMIIEKAIHLDLSYYETPAFYDMLQRAQQEASYRPLAMLQGIFSLVREAIVLLSLVTMMFYFSPWIVLLSLATAIPVLLVQSSYGRTSFYVYRERAPEARQLAYLSLLLTARNFAKEIKLFGLGRTLLDRYKKLYAKFYQENRKLSIRRNLGSAGLQLVALLGYYGAYFAVILQAVDGRITLGDLTMYSTVIMQMQAAAGSLVLGLANMYEHNLFLSNLFTFLNLQPRLSPAGTGQPAPFFPQCGIEMQDVVFQYPGADHPVLCHVNLKIAPGEKIALVGENGAGKTTLIKLLTRLYDPCEGRITLDGVDLREIDIESLHARIGVIFQDFVQYQLSGRENIGFGQIDALQDDLRIQAAAKKSGAHEVLSTLSNGYDTILGRWFEEKGSDLSIGQWQKVALARAYMRDTPILILDEPTSALDAMAEYEVYQHFRELTVDRTVILISHRFSTVRMADRIFVFDKGQIVEQGTHEELLTAGGLYATMFNLQADGYR